jgi:hypothetical protein
MVQTLHRLATFPMAMPVLSPDPLMYHSDVWSLAESLCRASASRVGGLTLGAALEQISLRELMAALRRRSGLRIFVPIAALSLVAKVAQRARIPLPFRPDSIAGLQMDRVAESAAAWTSGFRSSTEFILWAGSETRTG